MSVEEVKALVERFGAAWEKGDLAELDEVLAPNFVFHSPPPGLPGDRAGYKQFVSMYHAAFGDMRITEGELVITEDKVARRVIMGGTHTGDFMGIPPTGKQVAMEVITIERIEGGKVAEQWGQGDLVGLLQQLGAMPGPG